MFACQILVFVTGMVVLITKLSKASVLQLVVLSAFTEYILYPIYSNIKCTV
jgi:hypothetical protein